MKLHAVDRQLFMSHTHDHTAARARGHLQHCGQGFWEDGQRVVACGGKWIWKPLQHTNVGMEYTAGLTVQQFRRPVYGGTECDADRLVSKAHSEQWRTGACTRMNQSNRGARTFRRARSRAEQHPIELNGDSGQVGQPGVIIAPHLGLDTKLSEILHQVEDETVVVVDDQDPHRDRLPSVHHWACGPGEVHPHRLGVTDDRQIAFDRFVIAQTEPDDVLFIKRD